MAAAFTVKMGMRRMIIAGGQTVNKRTPSPAQALDQSMLHKQVKDPIDGHAIDRIAVTQDFVNFSGRKWEVMAADDLQNTETVSGDSKIIGL
jgi:hypothetical protein